MRDKCKRALGLALVLVLAAQSAAAQQVDARPTLTPGQVGSFAAAGAMIGLGVFLDTKGGPAPCAPCDPQTVPAFDRWMIRPPVQGFSRASDLLLLGLAGGTLVHGTTSASGWSGTVVSLEAAAWTMGITQLSKVIIARERPVLYTADAASVADQIKNQRSMPSGHTSIAFALATSYWVNNSDVGIAPKILAVVGATGVGVLRVAAAKHFPSDVVVGAVVGTATALIVHEIRF